MDWEDEETWLRGRIIRVRTLLRYARTLELRQD